MIVHCKAQPLFAKSGKDMIATIAIASWCCLGFVLPFSTALCLLFSAIAIVSSVLLLNRENAIAVAMHPISIATLLLFLWLTVTIAWSVAPPDEIREGISKYRKLLIPIFVALPFVYLKRDPNALLKAFVFGNLAIAIIAVVAWAGVFGQQGLNLGFFRIGGASEPIVGRNRITQGAFYIFAALLIYVQVLNNNSRLKLPYFWIVLLSVITLIALSGRTGYLIFVVAVVALVLIRILNGEFKQAVKIMIPSALLFITAVFLSQHMSSRLIQVGSELINDQMGGVSERLHFYRVGLHLYVNNPLFGSGIASYAQGYSESGLQLSQYQASRLQPHSEFVLQAVQGGSIGLILFFALIWVSLGAGYRQDKKSGIFAVVLVCFFAGAAINSYIWDLAEGHFFALFLGYLIAQDVNKASLMRRE
jgi:hypothetical protein